jgi:hypothetical protein
MSVGLPISFEICQGDSVFVSFIDLLVSFSFLSLVTTLPIKGTSVLVVTFFNLLSLFYKERQAYIGIIMSVGLSPCNSLSLMNFCET